MAPLDSGAAEGTLTPPGSQNHERLLVRVRGLVQGVGFRPHVYRLALECALTGWVRNDGAGVILEIQGARTGEFLTRLQAELPPLARIDSLTFEPRPLQSPEEKFVITASEATTVSTSIVPDAATCADCLREATSPGDRRFGYPFLNCTHCGPRYTITKRLPYDRAQTSMAPFPMCPECETEYHDPLDRRFHAQPTACPRCGPRLSHSVSEVAARLREGAIVGIKGLGGFHLACDATNERAVSELRRRKNREAKPFAVMVANVASARRWVEVSAPAEALLRGTEKPIVLLPVLAHGERHATLAPSVAPGMSTLGVMVPYTPLHHLLFWEFLADKPLESVCETVLVMTSANPGGEPLVISNHEAQARLDGIADVVVTHDRDILIRVDDSVVTLLDGAPYFIRRARGYVPRSIRLPHAIPATVAFGAELKNTITVTRGDEAFVSQHVGDLDNASTLEFLHETVAHMLSILEVEPCQVACDSHPDFASTHAARSFARKRGLPLKMVQHHFAHLAASVVDAGVTPPALGVALDGFGLGSDGGSWGGELIFIDAAGMRRIGRLATLKQPGGDVASREPWRMGAAALHAMGRGERIPSFFSNLASPSTGLDATEIVAKMLELGLNSPETSGAGRWFDAACGLLRIQDFAAFEGQAPMKLEALCRDPRILEGGFSFRNEDGLRVLDLLPTLVALADGVEARTGSELFHGTFAAALSTWVNVAAREHRVTNILLSGGCFLNRVLTENLIRSLRELGLNPIVPRQLPPNDACISLGQAWLSHLHTPDNNHP